MLPRHAEFIAKASIGVELLDEGGHFDGFWARAEDGQGINRHIQSVVYYRGCCWAKAQPTLPLLIHRSNKYCIYRIYHIGHMNG